MGESKYPEVAKGRMLRRDEELFWVLHRLQGVIGATATGEARNALCDAQINLMHAQQLLKEKQNGD